MEKLGKLTLNLSSASSNLYKGALRHRVNRGQPLVLGSGRGQGHEDKQEDNG